MQTEIINETTKAIRVRPYTTRELAEIYGICSRTMKRWIEPLKEEVGEKRGRYYTVNQVRIIFEEIGLPGYINLN